MEPRERFTRFGPTRFGDAELLSLIIGAGAPAMAAVARTLLARFGDLSALADADVSELTQVPGLGPARAVQLLAAMEVGKRSMLPTLHKPQVRSAAEAYELLYAQLSGRPQEMLYAIYLNRRKAVLAVRQLTVGNDAHTIVDPRQVYRRAVRSNAAAVIVAHNHPSGDAEPSAQDLAVTRRLAEAGAVVGVELLDHLIIGAGCYTSLADRGLFRPFSPTPPVIRSAQRGVSGLR
ncbi:MAG: DNA repair protein RadC [Myxococcota bacterium]